MFPLDNLSCVVVSALSSINSRLFADQQGGCSRPSRTNMRFFVSPYLTTRTSPNWCRRWIWSKLETASPWHMLVSIAGNLPPPPTHFACSSTSQRAFDSRSAQEKIASLLARHRRVGWLASWTVARDHGGLISPFCSHSVILRSISAASLSLESSLFEFLFIFFFVFNGCHWSPCAFSPTRSVIHKGGYV